MIPVELVALVINERADEQIIYLRERDGERQFPIVIGMFEAFVIDRLVKERPTERPLTHDLLASVIAHLGARVVRIAIDDLREETFFAKLVLVGADGAELLVDARPSDAVAVALKTQAPIFVAEEVLNRCC